MSIGTFTDLKAAVATWLVRGDQTARIPDYIALAEDEINRAMGIRSIESDQTLSLLAGARTVALPTGFREALNLWPVLTNGRGEPLLPIMPELMTVQTAQAEPRAWCVDGSNIGFDCPTDQARTYVLRMRGGVCLSESAPTNLILTNYPTLYLYKTLEHACVKLRDFDLMATVKPLAEKALAGARYKESRDKGRTQLVTEFAQIQQSADRYDITRDR